MRTVVCLAAALALVVAGPGSAPAAPGAGTAHAGPDALAPAAAIAQKQRKRAVARRGGKVRKAWPRKRSGRRPPAGLARWLAKQVGPAGGNRRGAMIAQTPTSVGLSGSALGRLWLVRSFAIPTDDPAHDRLANYSWTYDNALATFAFLSVGAKGPAEQLLDQLKALQRSDGAIEFAFDVSSGTAAPLVRSGALAWVGLAAAAYRREYDSSRYDALLDGIVRYLLSLRTSAGLVRGGPDVGWVSTQHNLLTVALLRDLADQLGSKRTIAGRSAADLAKTHAAIGDAVVRTLLSQESASVAYFRQGVDDGQIPLDVQAFGAIYLRLRGDARATHVLNAIQSKFAVPPRRTASGAGPYSGYRPYVGTGTPDVVWTEGTAQASLAFARLGVANSAADAAVASLATTIAGSAVGPIGADRDVVSQAWGEYHTWPASAAASWMLIRVAREQLLFAH